MTQKSELMALGMAHGLANESGFDAANAALTATGTNQATALLLTSNFSLFTTVSASTGALLPQARSQAPLAIFNGGGAALTVYPNGSETVNATTSVSIPNGKSGVFFASGNQWIANISA